MPRTKQPNSALLGTVLALVVVGIPLTLLGMSWYYPRPVTTAAVLLVSLVVTLIARRLLPPSWRPAGVAAFLVAAAAAYLVIQFGSASGWSGFLDHRILTPSEGEVDEVSTWIFGALGAAAGFGSIVALRRWTARRSETGGVR
jgi:glucan phosphoethanolaminetransferase (alkaline phosphatase superfamily)